MDGRIELWQRTYRVRGPAAQRRLEALVSGPVLRAYEDALNRAFGAGPEVILIRRVSLRLTAKFGPEGDTALASAWGAAMSAAVVDAITHAAPEDVVRFPDKAAHLAAFLTEIATNGAANQWYYRGFVDKGDSSIAAVVARVLLAQPGEARFVLRRLMESGSLARVLSLLDPSSAARLWSAMVTVAGAAGPERERPLFAAALRLLVRLGAPEPSRLLAESWFDGFFANLLSPTDWRDTTHLSRTFFAAVRFLLARMKLPRPLQQSIDFAVQELDWLDTAWLKPALAELLQTTQGSEPFISFASPHASTGVSALQRQWIEAVQEVLPGVAEQFDWSNLRSYRNQLLLLGAVTHARPAWVEDSSVARFLESLLAAAWFTAQSPAQDSAQGGSPHELPAAQPLGPDAVDLIRALAARVRVASAGEPFNTVPTSLGRSLSSSALEWAPSAAVGAMLLLRAVNDLRLVGLSRRCEFPSAGSDGPLWLIPAVLARLAGLPSGPITDPGLLLLSAHEACSANSFHAAWDVRPDSARRFQTALADVLLGQKFLTLDEAIHTALLELPGGGSLLLSGDPTCHLWPFATPTRDGHEVTEATLEHLERWKELGGVLSGESLSEEYPALRALADSLSGSVGNKWADATIFVTAATLLRAWARWLKSLGASSSPYLLRQFIRRKGRVAVRDKTLLVELEPQPVDVVLQLSGYLDPIEFYHDGPFRVIHFRVGGSSS